MKKISTVTLLTIFGLVLSLGPVQAQMLTDGEGGGGPRLVLKISDIDGYFGGDPGGMVILMGGDGGGGHITGGDGGGSVFGEGPWLGLGEGSGGPRMPVGEGSGGPHFFTKVGGGRPCR